MLEINITLVYQIIGYFVLLVILNKLLYKPVMRILSERDEKIGGAMKKAADTDKEVSTGIVEYEKRLKEAALKGQEERNRLKQEARAREKEILDAAGAQVANELASMRKKLADNKAGAMHSLRGEAQAISRSIADKLMDKKTAMMILALLMPLVPVIAGAAEEHEAAGPGSFWKIVNFAVLVAAIVILWQKVVKGLLNKRSAEIKTALEQAQAAKAVAEKKAAEYKEKLASLEGRINEITNEIRLEGESEKTRILLDAEAASKRMTEQAKLTVEQEIKKAKIELRQEAAALAVSMAQEILKKELGPEDQQRLIKGYLDNLRLN